MNFNINNFSGNFQNFQIIFFWKYYYTIPPNFLVKEKLLDKMVETILFHISEKDVNRCYLKYKPMLPTFI